MPPTKKPSKRCKVKYRPYRGRPQPSSVGYAAEAHQGIAGEGNRTQERGGRAYYLVEQGSKMVPSNKGYAQSRKGVPCRRFQPRADGGTDDGQAP